VKSSRKKPVHERVSALAPGDRAHTLETIARSFSGVERMERHMVEGLWRGSAVNPEDTRVVVVDGRVVSTVVMSPRTIRFGPVTVPAMTVGPVATHDRYRKRNFASLSMQDATRSMKERGILVAYLQGIPNFYHRFGYYPYLARSSAKFSRENAAKVSLPGRLRALTKRDLPAARRLYDAASAGRICAAVRGEDVWNWLLRFGTNTWVFTSPRVILDSRGTPCGYVTTSDRDGFSAREIVVKQDERSLRVTLGALVREAKRREAKEITLSRLPWDDPLAVYLRQYVGAEFTLSSNPTGGPLLLLVDFPVLMKRLEPLFSKRWTEAHSALRPAAFTLKSEIGAVGLQVSGKGVALTEPARGLVVKVPQRWLSGLLTGYYSVDDIASRDGARIPSELKPVLNILFPKGWPFVYQGDDF
jgi:predicted N-acetyltransferase YhbS